ncbi:MAG TPA: hypothetical protein PLN30_13680, partial [Ferruginibacter sp.]|nr:hypothetical protein [Ferruginibacter sp.]
QQLLLEIESPMAKAYITSLFFMLVSLYVNGQVANTEANVTDSSNKIYTENLGTEASFPGGPQE